MAKTCPVCGLLNPDVQQRCDCGYDFPSQIVVTASREMSVTEVGRRTISRGVVVIVGGLIALGLQFRIMVGGNADNFLMVYAAGAFFTLALGIHQIVRGIGIRSRGRKLHPDVRY